MVVVGMSFREYFRLKTHNEKWVRQIMERYNLSEHYIRIAEYTLKREAYIEYMNGAYL